MIAVWKNLTIRHRIEHLVTGLPPWLGCNIPWLFITRVKNLYDLKPVTFHGGWSSEKHDEQSHCATFEKKISCKLHLMWKSWKTPDSIKIMHLKKWLDNPWLVREIYQILWRSPSPQRHSQNPMTNGKPVKIKHFPITSLNSSEEPDSQGNTGVYLVCHFHPASPLSPRRIDAHSPSVAERINRRVKGESYLTLQR